MKKVAIVQEENPTRDRDRDASSSKYKSYSRENRHLKEDFDVLKSVIRRLNKELTFYQEKLRGHYAPNKIPVFSSSESATNLTELEESRTELDEPKRILLPLLTAYDEIIAEKQDIIKENEIRMERFKLKCQEIVQENEMLHKIIQESKVKGSISIEEWQFVYDNAVIVVEENDLLHDKIEVLQRKNTLIQNSHDARVAKLKSKLAILEDQKARLVKNTSDIELQMVSFKEQIKKMGEIIQMRIPKEEHEASVGKCREEFENLKRQYMEERTTLIEKVASVEAEKERLVIVMTDSEAENAKLQDKMNKLEASISLNNQEMQGLRNSLSVAVKKDNISTATVAELMELVKNVFAEKEAAEKSFHEQLAINEQMRSFRANESELAEEFHQKIEEMRNVHREEIKHHLTKIENLQELLETIGERHQHEISVLKDLVNEKSVHIDTLRAEKRQLIRDMETVWRATTAKHRDDGWQIPLENLSYGVVHKSK